MADRLGESKSSGNFAVRLARVEAAIMRLIQTVTDMDTRLRVTEATAAETNLRVIYIMRHFNFQRLVTTGLLDAQNKPIVEAEAKTLEQLYLMERDTFQAALLKEAQDVYAKLQADADDKASQGRGNGHGTLGPAPVTESVEVRDAEAGDADEADRAGRVH